MLSEDQKHNLEREEAYWRFPRAIFERLLHDKERAKEEVCAMTAVVIIRAVEGCAAALGVPPLVAFDEHLLMFIREKLGEQNAGNQ